MHARRLSLIALGALVAALAVAGCDCSKCMGSGTFVPDCSGARECMGRETRGCDCVGWGFVGTMTCEDEVFGACACPPPPACGDAVCEGLERMMCTGDCRAVCGDRICEPLLGETTPGCPDDCPTVCGDLFCDPRTETEAGCAVDCTIRCGDSLCEDDRGEVCALDCGPTCGDGLCELDDPAGCADCARTCGERAAWTTGLGASLGGPGVAAPALIADDGVLRLATADSRSVLLAEIDESVVTDWVEHGSRAGSPPALVATESALLLGSRFLERPAIDVLGADGSVLTTHVLAESSFAAPALAWEVGRGVTAWVDARSALQAMVLDAAGTPTGGAIPLGGMPRDEASVAAGPTGWLVAWPETRGARGEIVDTHVVLHDWTGARIAAIEPLDTLERPIPVTPAVVWTGTDFVVAWSAATGPAWAVIRPDGMIVRREAPRRLLAPSNHVALAVTGDRLTLVDAVSDGTETTTFVTEIALDGAPLAPAARLTCNSGSEEDPAVAHDPTTGRTFVAYLRRENRTAATELTLSALAPAP